MQSVLQSNKHKIGKLVIILTHFMNSNKLTKNKKTRKILFGNIRDTKIFLKNHPELINTWVDQCNITVVLDMNILYKKVGMLNDEELYWILLNDVTIKIKISLIRKFFENNYIDEKCENYVTVKNRVFPKMYFKVKFYIIYFK